MVVAGLSTGSPVAPRPLSNLLVKAGETLHIDIPMEKLVLVKGTIRTDDPPAPVAGARISVRYGKGFQSEMVTSDHQGHFEAPRLAGPCGPAGHRPAARTRHTIQAGRRAVDPTN